MSEPCPACGEQAPVIFEGYPGYREPDTFDICRCPACGTSFVRFDGRDLSGLYDAIYRQADDVPGYLRYARLARAVEKSPTALDDLAASETTYYGIREHLKGRRDARILEVGSGLGYLTYALSQAGFSASGLDISATAVRGAGRRFGDALYTCADLFRFAASNPGRYDLVILTEVIEHLPAPHPFLSAALELLAPGGEVLLTTPDRDGYAPEVAWEVESPPVHLTWLSRESLRALARRLGVEVSFVDLGGFPGGHAGPVRGAPGGPRRPTLNARGELVAYASPLGRMKRAAKWALRRAGLRHEPPLAPAVDPTLCAVFRK